MDTQNSEQMLNALMELILNAEFEESDIHTLYEKLLPYIKPFVEMLSIAKIDIHLEFAPNSYDLSGKGDSFGTTFRDDAGSEPMTLNYVDLYMTTGTVKLYPVAGHEWSEEERKHISAVSRLVAIQFSRVNMVHRIERLSYIDLLTGLANSPGVSYYGARIERNGSIGDYAGCFVNLKNFKFITRQLNSASNSPANSSGNGNAVIRQYALRLYGFMDHRSELVARLGGDNFFALVRKERLDRFLKFASSLNLILNSEGMRTRLTVDSWIGVYPANDGDPVSTVLSNASFANEQAKKNHVPIAYFDPAAMDFMLHVKQVAQTLPAALRAHELSAFYQPKVNTATGELYGAEALVRWNRDGKFISPAEFVPAAEASGMVTAIDLYMLDVVCRDLRRWLDDGIEPVCVSVNYSQSDFYRETLVKDTLDILQKYDIDGKYLEIEITESSFYENLAALQEFIRVMHENGVKVSLDDFGTGYSSLNMLKSLDLDTIKLDKSFFENLNSKDEKDRVVLRKVADMINELQKTAVSEGVEDAEQIDFARQIGCDIVQGYFFDKPMSCNDFTARLLDRHYDLQQDG